MIRFLMICTLMLFTTTALAAPKKKVLICHVGNEVGPDGGEYDPDCTPSEENGYFCPDAGKVDLILTTNSANHLENPSHAYDGISDYEPSEVGASGEGTEDSDGDGIDDGCEPEVLCPCWDVVDLQSVTAENIFIGQSCDDLGVPGNEVYPNLAKINNNVMTDVEGGFVAYTENYSTGQNVCGTRDYPPYVLQITLEEASACIAQIATRCAEIGHPITP